MKANRFFGVPLAILLALSASAEVRVTSTTVIDTDSGLEWQMASPGKMRWRDGINYCRELKLNDVQDWRLPSKQELGLGAKIAVHFKDLKPVFYWTATDYEKDREKSWVVNLVYGFIGYDDGGFSYDVKCVRGLK